MIVPEKPEEWRCLPITYSANDTTAGGIHLVAGLISAGNKHKAKLSNLAQIELQVTYRYGITKSYNLSLHAANLRHGLQTIERTVEEDIMRYQGQQLEGQVGLNVTRPGGVPTTVVNYLKLPSLEVVVKGARVTFCSLNGQVIHP